MTMLNPFLLNVFLGKSTRCAAKVSFSQKLSFKSYLKDIKCSQTISWICIILGKMVWADTVSHLILTVGQCDLYFMVQ